MINIHSDTTNLRSRHGFIVLGLGLGQGQGQGQGQGRPKLPVLKFQL